MSRLLEKYWHLVWTASAALASVGLLLCQPNPKSKENTKSMFVQVEKAAAEIAAFEKNRATEHLQSAMHTLEDVNFSAFDSTQRRKARNQLAKTWLSLLSVIDRSLDPAFDPAASPERGVIPPPSGGEQLPP